MSKHRSKTCITVHDIHAKYIEGTETEAQIIIKKFLLCDTTYTVKKSVPLISRKIYISTRSLKHIYDKHKNQSYDVIKQSLWKIARFPNTILLNSENKRGQYIFTKVIQGQLFCLVLEENNEEKCYEVVTAFPTKNDKYLRKYQEIWCWRNGESSS